MDYFEQHVAQLLTAIPHFFVRRLLPFSEIAQDSKFGIPHGVLAGNVGGSADFADEVPHAHGFLPFLAGGTLNWKPQRWQVNTSISALAS